MQVKKITGLQWEERAYMHWLCSIDGIGKKTIGRLLREEGSARRIHAMTTGALEHSLASRQLEAFLKAKEKDVLEGYRRLEKYGIHYLPASDPSFPHRLREIPDPPVGLYVRGFLPDPSLPAVALVGTRVCSEYGSLMARWFSSRLVKEGVSIISGLAQGIDSIGQEAALGAGGDTFALLGCGIDVCYPTENRRLYEEIVLRGGILSEYPPGTLPRPGLFPQRNRLISGLSDLVLVVEAREKSGTCITVDMALEQGRQVMAVPGRATDPLSYGCNLLIRQGAGIAMDVDTVLWELEALRGKWEVPRTGRNPAGAGAASSAPVRTEQARSEPAGAKQDSSIPDRPDAKGHQAKGLDHESFDSGLLYTCLDVTPLSLGQIQRQACAKGLQLQTPELSARLTQMVLDGRCVQEGGYYYRKEV